MISAEECCLNLSDLPSDIIRNVIKLSVEFVDNMSLISPRWNSIAKNFLSDRRNLPKIKCIQWDLDKLMSPVFRMTLKEKYRPYFGVCDWPTKPATLDSSESVEVMLNYGAPYDESFPSNHDDNVLAKIQKRLKRCYIIEKVELKKFGFVRSKVHFNAIGRTLSGVAVNTSSVSANDRTLDRKLSLWFLDLLTAIEPLCLLLPDSYHQLHHIFDYDYPFLSDVYYKVTQIVHEIECYFMCFQCDEDGNRKHCEELSSKIASKCKVATELSFVRDDRAEVTRIIMRKI